MANLPPALRPILLQMQPGQVSQPLQVPGAVVLFYLRGTQGTLRPGAEEQILDYVRFSLANRQDAARIAALSDTCADLFVHARGLPPEQIQRQSLPQGQIPTGDAIRLAVLDDNESTLITEGGAAVTLLMLCKRTPALLANAPPRPVATAPGEEPAQPDPAALRPLPPPPLVAVPSISRPFKSAKPSACWPASSTWKSAMRSPFESSSTIVAPSKVA